MGCLAVFFETGYDDVFFEGREECCVVGEIDDDEVGEGTDEDCEETF